jgi:hypothetical protein
VERKWKNYHIITFPGQSLSKTGLSLEEAMDLSRDTQIEEEVKIFSDACHGIERSALYSLSLANLYIVIYF